MAKDRRQQLIEAAFALLADTPLSELSTRQIARRVGVSQPAMFRHFRSRDALLVAVVDHARDELGARAARLLQGEGDAVWTLQTLARTLMAYVQDNPGLPRLLFSDGAGAGAEVRAALGRLLTMQRSLVARIVQQGQAAGLLDGRVEAIRAAWLFVGMIQGMVLQWQIEGRRAGLVDEAGPMMRLWLRGVGWSPAPREGSARGGTTGDLDETEGPGEGGGGGEEERREGDPAGGEPPEDGGAGRGLSDGIGLIDVRETLAGGRDPLEDIVAALEPLAPGAALLVVAPFRPAPLLALLVREGHAVSTHALPDGGWAVAVVVGGGAPIVDLRDAEPPEPMEAALEATEALAPGAPWMAWMPRHPRLLLPLLADRPVRHAVRVLPDGVALLHLRRAP